MNKSIDSLNVVAIGKIPSVTGGYDKVSLVKYGDQVLDSLTHEVMPPTRVKDLLVYYQYRQGYPDGVGGVFAAHPDGTLRRITTPLLNVLLTSPRAIGEWLYYWGFEPKSEPSSSRLYEISLMRVNIISEELDSIFVRKDYLKPNYYRYYHPMKSKDEILFYFKDKENKEGVSDVYVVEADSSLESFQVRRHSSDTDQQ